MPMFSQKSFSRLSSCHIDLQAVFFEVVKTFDCTVLEGYRNETDQRLAYDRGATELQYPNSMHNKLPSMAVDVQPYPIDWNNTSRMYYFAGYVMGVAQKLKDEGKITHSLRWGGDWNSNTETKDQAFNDLSHFEIIP